ncbi:oxygen-insensitive NADPH nitroreductase [Salisediminibacterium selenitireducens]|uniref:Nitroreductase n=1 Tax=Bacillus selenitireducens (strain ATCC 700615 / DSM 15326 / MLS10) TaxID=439292 RepID=D6XTF9_BACIE|nr:oxygen-insensitive NADPH nitroreductase [Salisediminibacterium selenitireducens]ADH99095.1 nitroreductase [[Bacillus] selenitireducens MLS10]
MTNETIETMLNHRSIRFFKEETLSDEQIATIVRAAQSASTSSFIQAYSIIGVKDPEKKALLSEYAGNQPYVLKNGHFMIFCADLHRHVLAAEMEDKSAEEILHSLESTEKFIVSVIDASLAAQNAAVAAESMGLGICYIGGIRNELAKVIDLLGCPSHVLPLFGLAIGIPEHTSDLKPRLPYENIYHEESYQPDDDIMKKQLAEYNQIISDYYNSRTAGKRQDRWTQQMVSMLSKRSRMTMDQIVRQQQLMKDERQ